MVDVSVSKNEDDILRNLLKSDIKDLHVPIDALILLLL